MLSSPQLSSCLRISWFCKCLCNARQPLSGHCSYGSRRQLNSSQRHNASSRKSNYNTPSRKPYNNNTPTWKFYHNNNNNNLQNNKTCNNNIFSHNRIPRQLLWYNVLLKERVSIVITKVPNLSLN